MHVPKSRPRTDRTSDLSPRASWLLVLLLIVSIVPLVTMGFSVKAAEDRPGVQADETDTDSAVLAPGVPEDALGDYHLAPGDRLTIAVFDEPQLSGDFFIDGGGEILLPVAGSVRISGLTLAEAQELIQKQFADGVLHRPAVSVRIKEYRPIFVTGEVKRPGSYKFMLGESVEAAIATAGGEGQALEQPLGVAISDFITADERVRKLEAEKVSMFVRKARLEAQRDERENFVMPLLVGLDVRNVDFQRVYSAESDTFLRLQQTYRGQLETLQKQQPRIEAETNAVTDQIAKQNKQLDIVNVHLADLEYLQTKGLVRKEVLLNQQIEKTLVEFTNIDFGGRGRAPTAVHGRARLQDRGRESWLHETSFGRAAGNLAAPARDRDGSWSGTEVKERKGRSREQGNRRAGLRHLNQSCARGSRGPFRRDQRNHSVAWRCR